MLNAKNYDYVFDVVIEGVLSLSLSLRSTSWVRKVSFPSPFNEVGLMGLVQGLVKRYGYLVKRFVLSVVPSQAVNGLIAL